MATSSYTWTGIDDTSRVDSATVDFGAGGMTAFGTATADSFATVWRLEVDAQWTTRRLEVTARGLHWSRAVVLLRSADGAWEASADAAGDLDQPPPGLADPSEVLGATDCDLGLCPLTNTMPIRRLGLHERNLDETALVMAWVDVPSLQVIRSDQIYARDTPGRVLFSTADRTFHAELTVDPDGVVVDYPGLARRVVNER